MKKSKQIISTQCDFCGKEITDSEEFNGVSDANPVGVISLKYDIWYGGVHQVSESCKSCNNKISRFLSKENMLHGQKIT